MPLSAHVSTASGQKMTIAEGSQLVFGRGPGVDLAIAAGRGLSRRAGVVTAMAAGAWIANISRTHALYVEGDAYRIRLPRMEDDGEPADGWFVHTGTAYVGSRGMLDDEQPLAVTVAGRFEGWSRQAGGGSGGLATAGSVLADGAALAEQGWLADADGLAEQAWLADAGGLAGIAGAGAGRGAGGRGEGGGRGDAGGRGEGGGRRAGEGTLLPFYIDPMTKLFLVALMWCRPWLLDQSATRPLPRTPEIARGALEVTGAYHELERFDSDPEFRDVLSARVAEHIKVLRRKITDRGLARADVRLSDEVAVRILIEHGIITSADLGRLDDPAWRSRQEDLWWTQA
ncbi:MAG: hypothetical protein ABSA53_11985 [Streptosporangiaceae bacterium]|jgi:hypothetical protein